MNQKPYICICLCLNSYHQSKHFVNQLHGVGYGWLHTAQTQKVALQQPAEAASDPSYGLHDIIVQDLQKIIPLTFPARHHCIRSAYNLSLTIILSKNYLASTEKCPFPICHASKYLLYPVITLWCNGPHLIKPGLCPPLDI